MSQNNQLPRISSLNSTLINQIAAGEVIERPSSVVKELVENAIDSGADRIDIYIDRGGTEKILIKDNGCGIHPDDLELAIQRHTTSKLRDQEGLNAIRSLGFRGEALSSIAAISDFSIVSRIPTAEHAVKLEFDPYTSRSRISPASANVGTTVEVIKLFQPVPVRRKFLRSPKTEYLHVFEVLKRLALSHYEIDFRFYHNGKQKLYCPASHQKYDDRIASVLDRPFYNNAWFIDGSIQDIKVWGWLGNAKTARNQSDRQYLFLNGRIIKDKHISHAIRKAMESVMHESRYPSYIIYLDVDPAIVDVNVHPTKQEVRFRSPRTVHDFIYALISDLIRQHTQAGSLVDTDNVLQKDQPERINTSLKINDLPNEYSVSDLNLSENSEDLNHLGIPVMILPGNILITRRGDELRIIDFANLTRHYLLESLSEQIEQSKLKPRPLLVPVNFTFSDEQIHVVIDNSAKLEQLGFEVTPSGPNTILVRSVPSSLPDVDIEQVLHKFINTFQQGVNDTGSALMEVLSAMVEYTAMDYSFTSLSEIKSILKRYTSLGLPFLQKNLKGYWRTINSQELLQILNDGK